MKKNYSIALIDNNILDKALYIENKQFWEVEELKLVSEQNKEESIKIIRATKKFLNSQGKEAAKIIEARDKLPDHKDNTVLFALISIAQEQNSPKIETSYYQILKKLNWYISSKNYNQIRNSLKVWHNLKITYKNCFYTYQTGHINFSSYIITSIEEHESQGKLIIQFEPNFLQILIENKFFTGLNIPNYGKLSSGFQRRLYEILSKSFKNSLTFEIGWKKLQKKIEDTSKYKSEFIRKVKRAIKSINEKTDLKIEFQNFENTLLFRLVSKEKTKFFNIIWYLESTKNSLNIDNDFILLFKNKCELKQNENKDSFFLICKDPILKERINENPYLKKALYINKIDFII